MKGQRIKPWEFAWISLCVLITITLSFMNVISGNVATENVLATIISCITSVTGIIYVFLIAKQNRVGYVFAVVNISLYAWVVFNNQLYASAAYNAFYSLPMVIYGFFYWGNSKDETNNGIKTLSEKTRIFGGIGIVIAIGVIALFLNRFFDGQSELLDAATTVLTCVATFLMANKYVEQWALFIISNLAGVIMFLTLNIGNLQSVELLFMWCFYLINSIYGAIIWGKTVKS